MIKRFNPNNKHQFEETLLFVKNVRDEDFYLTKENKRVYVNTEKDLKSILKESKDIWINEKPTEVTALILLWKSIGGDKKRDYVKIVAKDYNSAKDVVKCFLWNTFTEMYVKLKKQSSYLSIFKRGGFKFKGGRGKQILLSRDKIKRTIKPRYKKYERNNK